MESVEVLKKKIKELRRRNRNLRTYLLVARATARRWKKLYKEAKNARTNS